MVIHELRRRRCLVPKRTERFDRTPMNWRRLPGHSSEHLTPTKKVVRERLVLHMKPQCCPRTLGNRRQHRPEPGCQRIGVDRDSQIDNVALTQRRSSFCRQQPQLPSEADQRLPGLGDRCRGGAPDKHLPGRPLQRTDTLTDRTGGHVQTTCRSLERTLVSNHHQGFELGRIEEHAPSEASLHLVKKHSLAFTTAHPYR